MASYHLEDGAQLSYIQLQVEEIFESAPSRSALVLLQLDIPELCHVFKMVYPAVGGRVHSSMEPIQRSPPPAFRAAYPLHATLRARRMSAHGVY